MRQNNSKLNDHDDRIQENLRKIEDLQSLTLNHTSLVNKCVTDIMNLQSSKTDQARFDLYIENVDSKLKSMNEYTELSRNMVQGCQNYLEKYQPLFVHRQITDALDNVITNVKQKWRIKKYAESKGSFFTDKILGDDGSPDLEGRVEKTKIGLKTGQPT